MIFPVVWGRPPAGNAEIYRGTEHDFPPEWVMAQVFVRTGPARVAMGAGGGDRTHAMPDGTSVVVRGSVIQAESAEQSPTAGVAFVDVPDLPFTEMRAWQVDPGNTTHIVRQGGAVLMNAHILVASGGIRVQVGPFGTSTTSLIRGGESVLIRARQARIDLHEDFGDAQGVVIIYG